MLSAKWMTDKINDLLVNIVMPLAAEETDIPDKERVQI